jgi:hypothetical protein
MRRGRFFSKRVRWGQRLTSRIAPEHLRDLNRANRLMERGDLANAAQLYVELGRIAHDSGRPRQAAHLYAQAARALTLSGQTQAGMNTLQQGLELLAAAEMWGAFLITGRRTVAELTQIGLSQQAQELDHWLQAKTQGLPPAQLSSNLNEAITIPPHLQLPTRCPACGAPIRSDELEWIDESTSECAYCGSGIEAS